MTNPSQTSLADVLDMLLAVHGAPTSDAITEFARRYPQYRPDLMEFAADWAAEMHLPEPEPFTTEQEFSLVSRAHSAFQNLAFEQVEQEKSATDSRVSLAALARRAGKTLDDIMDMVGLDRGLISKLNGCRIRPRTICPSLARSIALFLNVSEAQVISSWSGVPRPRALALRASLPFAPQEQEDFEMAVATSSLSAEQKAKLLSED
jgi:hypothetical protein